MSRKVFPFEKKWEKITLDLLNWSCNDRNSNISLLDCRNNEIQNSQQLLVRLSSKSSLNKKNSPSADPLSLVFRLALNYPLVINSSALENRDLNLRQRSHQSIIRIFRLYQTSHSKMQKEAFAIFKPVEEDILAQIKCDKLILSSPFWINGDRNQEVQVILSDKFMSLCQKGFYNDIFHFYVNIDFDLKFQLIYQGDKQLLNPDREIHTKKIGFRFHKENAPSVELEIACQEKIQDWVKFLTKSLNQFGFHKLYKPIRILGKGGFASVYEVNRVTDQKHFAVKAFSKMKTIHSEKQSQRLTLLNEIDMLRTFDNTNILKLEGVYESENSLYLVVELLSSGQLLNRIKREDGRFTPNEIKQFMLGMTKALDDMNRNRIMHRDIKPKNIMMKSNQTMTPVIVDFGLSAKVDSDDYLFYRCGTPGFVAPEILALEKGKKVELGCDVFSTGVIFHLLLTKRHLFEGKNFDQVYRNNRKMNFNLNSQLYKGVDREAMNLLKKMLAIDPTERISTAQMLHHPYLNTLMEEECDQKEIVSPIITISQKSTQNSEETIKRA